MNPYWSLNGSKLYQGHVLDVLRGLDAESVQCIVTSPPYWGLRDYGLPPVEWPAVSYAPMAGLAEIEIPGCDLECGHVWGEEQIVKSSGGLNSSTIGSGNGQSSNAGSLFSASQGSWCQRCGGWRGCLGLEPTPEMFVGHLVLVWRELRRVLRDDGVCWLNLGDSYASQGGSRAYGSYDGETGRGPGVDGSREPAGNLKPKDLIGIPWRVALALQADGWYLRSDIIWAKGLSFCPTYAGSCMPESVRDRPTKGHEYVFLLAKSARYFYDGDAVKEGASENTHSRGPEYHKLNKTVEPGLGIKDNESWSAATWGPVSSRNLRTVWTINPGSYSGAHFATFPPALVEPMIKAGSRPGDTVLDPFGGSGTTAIVAIRLQRKVILIELSRPYCDEHIIPRLEQPLQLEMEL